MKCGRSLSLTVLYLLYWWIGGGVRCSGVHRPWQMDHDIISGAGMYVNICDTWHQIAGAVCPIVVACHILEPRFSERLLLQWLLATTCWQLPALPPVVPSASL